MPFSISAYGVGILMVSVYLVLISLLGACSNDNPPSDATENTLDQLVTASMQTTAPPSTLHRLSNDLMPPK